MTPSTIYAVLVILTIAQVSLALPMGQIFSTEPDDMKNAIHPVMTENTSPETDFTLTSENGSIVCSDFSTYSDLASERDDGSDEYPPNMIASFAQYWDDDTEPPKTLKQIVTSPEYKSLKTLKEKRSLVEMEAKRIEAELYVYVNNHRQRRNQLFADLSEFEDLEDESDYLRISRLILDEQALFECRRQQLLLMLKSFENCIDGMFC